MNPGKQLHKRLKYQFNDAELLHAALTHRSAGAHNNERLEFLGDSILNFVVASRIFHLRPDYHEGQLTRLRANLVRGETLAEIARDLDLGSLLKLGSGELKSGGFKRASILADALEAVIGAIYLDGGFAAAEITINHLYDDRFNNLPSSEPVKDSKTNLQELLQARGLGLPEYHLVDSYGEAHAKTFVIGCEIDALGLKVKAEGSSRRKAEQSAAATILDRIEKLPII